MVRSVSRSSPRPVDTELPAVATPPSASPPLPPPPPTTAPPPRPPPHRGELHETAFRQIGVHGPPNPPGRLIQEQGPGWVGCVEPGHCWTGSVTKISSHDRPWGSSQFELVFSVWWNKI